MQKEQTTGQPSIIRLLLEHFEKENRDYTYSPSTGVLEVAIDVNQEDDYLEINLKEIVMATGFIPGPDVTIQTVNFIAVDGIMMLADKDLVLKRIYWLLDEAFIQNCENDEDDCIDYESC